MPLQTSVDHMKQTFQFLSLIFAVCFYVTQQHLPALLSVITNSEPCKGV